MRVIDLALPLLEAGKSLRFAIMPEGQDPDDLIRASGPGAVQKVLEAARPMVQLLWQREIEGKTFDSPERKAALDKALRAKIGTIKDPSIRQHYGQEIKDLRWQLFRPKPQQRGGGAKRRDWRAPPPAHAATRASALAAGPDTITQQLRETVILAAALSCPELVEEFEAGLEGLDCVRADTGAMRGAILRANASQPSDLPGAVRQILGDGAVEDFLSQSHLQVVPCLRHKGDAGMARATIAEELAKLDAARGLDAEILEAAEDLPTSEEEVLTRRLRNAAEAMQTAQKAESEDKVEYETAANGAAINREERSAFDAMLETIRYSKPGR